MSDAIVAPESVIYRGRDFTEAEARAITASIKAYAKQACFKLADAHQGRAYLAMGYETFEAYCAAELDISRSRGYQLLRHATAMRALGDAADLDPVSTNVHIGEGQTRAIDTAAVAAEVAAKVAAEPEADEHRRAEIVRETVEEHKVTTTETTSFDADTGEILDPSPTDAPVPPAGEPVDEAPGDRHHGPGAGELGAIPAAPEEGGGCLSPAPSADLDDAPLSPAMQRLKFAGTATRALGVVRERLLPLDPDEVMAAIPVDERAMWSSLSRDLRAYCDRIDAALAPNLRSVQ